MGTSNSGPVAGRAPKRARWWLRAAAMLAGLLVLAVGGGVWFLGTQAALDALIQRAVARSDGKLAVSGATGSLLSTVHIERLHWRGEDVRLDATGVALTWSPSDLFSRRFHAQGFAARHLAVTLNQSGESSSMPAGLALPLEVTIARAGIGRIDWTAGGRQGVVTGLAFGYAGGATEHRLHDLEFVTAAGTLSGNVTLGAAAPFPIAGMLRFAGDGDYRDAIVRAGLGGTLDAIAIDADVGARGARGTASARFSPFAPVAFTAGGIDVDGVDLARWSAALPSTRLHVALSAAPSGERFDGTIDVRNAEPGPVDAERVPLATLKSRFSWSDAELALSDATATMPGRGRATGRATVTFDGKPASFALDVADIDLQQIHRALGVTALSGTLGADVTGAVQNVRGDLRQAGMGFAFAATVQDRRLEVSRLLVTAGTGEVAARGRIALDGARAFSVNGTSRRLDPSRFGAFPVGALDATFAADGFLSPSWNAAVDLALAQGSQLSGVALSGKVRGGVAPRRVRDATATLRVGSGDVTVSGSAGAAGDRLQFALRAPDVAAWRPLLPAALAKRLPDVLGGSLRVAGSVQLDPRLRGGDLDVHGSNLAWGARFAVATVDAKAAIGLPGPAAGQHALDERLVTLSLDATDLRTPQGKFSAAHAGIDGTLARHKVDVALQGTGIDLHVAATGGLDSAAGDASQLQWSGTLDRLTNRGDYAVALEAPAKLVISDNHVGLSAAGIRIAEGHAEVADLSFDDGRVSSHGTFNAIPVAALVRMAGQDLPLRSTLTLKGDWAVVAAPRLNGAVHVSRDQGDLYATNAAVAAPAGLGFGITTLEAAAQFADDALSVRAQYASLRGGTGTLMFDLGANGREAPGHLARDAPLNLSLKAELPSLQALQPWLGTAAVIDGRARVDVSGRGTLSSLVLDGSVNGDDVRIDLPQYGVLLNAGRFRSRLDSGKWLLDEFSIAAGEGTFTAQGTLAATAASGAMPKITWQAEKFRVINRPDLRLVAGGSGTLALVAGKIELKGSVKFDEGAVEYQSTTAGTLADDVVIVGRSRPPPHSALGDLPLKLEVDVDLGTSFHFSGEGLETGLAGKVRIATLPNGSLSGFGTIQAVNGTYFSFGQKLTIDRGQLTFDGPLDNPALDVVALRKSLAVEAGVELTGTARFPRVRLVSNPPVPDNEKLAWLITGQGLDRASSGDMVALSAASATLLGRGQRPLTQDIANRVGLDDISFAQSGVANATGATRGQVVSFGKRLSDRLTLVYEQGLTIATNALRVEYALSRTLTLRAEAGIVGSFGIYFRRSFD